MAIQFILGRAGSGKTHYCLEAIRHELRQSPRGPALVLLVPEQATYQVERALVTTPDLGGYCRASVLSFRRLAHHMFLEIGGVTLPPLEATGKLMVLRSILKRRAGELRLFEKSARQRGFIERLAATLTELRAYGQWGDRLRAELARLEARGEGDTLLAAKLHDLALVIEEYEQFLAARYVDPDGYLDVLAQRLGEKNSLHGSLVWVDGFASLTRQEERVLGELMAIAADMKIALCLDPHEDETTLLDSEADPGTVSMFALLRETHARLTELARTKNKVVLRPLALPAPNQATRFHRVPALAHLERESFALGHGRPARGSAQGHVILTAATDQRSEVRDVAGEIVRLCREEGYRFREIAVIARDLTPYRTLIETIFQDYEIPYFIDVRRDVAHHPLVELIRSVLAVVVRGWRSQDVLRFAKTDLAPLDRPAVDWLENYVLAHGIEGEAWHSPSPWEFHRHYSLGEEAEDEGGQAAVQSGVDRSRQALAGLLRRFEEAAGREPSARARCRALFALLEELAVPERLEQWATDAEHQGRLDEAGEHRQVWAAVMDLLDQAVAALGGEAMEMEEFREVIEAGLAGIVLRLVPPALDQVLAGSIERSRHPEIRAAFVLGMNERVFPKPQLPDVVFGDREREHLAHDGLALGPVSDKRLLHEQFLAYVALTRPSERLYVSYAEADPMGKALHPSSYLDVVKRCFADLTVRRVGRAEPLDRLAHWRAALAGLTASLRPGRWGEPSPQRGEWLALYGAMRRGGRFHDALARRIGGVAYENRAHLRLRTAQRLYGARRESSVTRLECFAACPFRHFARYGLGLEERLRFRIERLDLGLLYHEVLREVFAQLSQGQALDWGAVEPAAAVAAVEEAVERLAPRLRNEILLSSGRNRYVLAAARGALTTFIRVMIAGSRRDRFRQVAAERAFGSGPGELAALEIDLGHGQSIRLRGRIDRIDESVADGAVARVIDYKSRPQKFDLNKLAHGLALQLPAYLLAVQQHGRKSSGTAPGVAGALYVPILRQIGSVTAGQAAKEADGQEKDDLKAWEARGLFEFRWAALFDAEVATNTGRSPVVSLAISKDGQPYAWHLHDALPDGALDALLRWAKWQMAELARQMLEGRIAVAPYRLRQETPCRWCEFRPVCRFDPQRERPRTLPTRRRDDALTWIGEQRCE